MTAPRLSRPGRRGTAAAIGFAFIGIAAACAAPLATGGTAPKGAAPESQPLRCEVAVTGPSSSRSFEARVRSDSAVSGTYRLVIRRGGASGAALISQSGEFSARPGETQVLGRATLGGGAATYATDFELQWNGKRLRCPQTTGKIDL